MIDIAVSDLNKYYGSNHVLKGVSFEIDSGEKVGLLGKNGSGKTTLFRILTGEEPYDSGSVSRASGKRIEMLAQIPAFGENDTAEDVLRSSFKEINGVYMAMKKIEGSADPADLKRYGDLIEEYERLGGYETEVKLEKVCGGMMIGGGMRSSPFGQLSGGEKTRVNLARILLRDCDILLLDEPTNHLDFESLEWLEKFLNEFAGTIAIISHDRVFLDRVVTRIVEIESGKAHFYSGNFSWYAEEKRRRYDFQLEQYERQQKEIKRIEERAKWFVIQDRFTTKHHAILSRIDHMDKIERPASSRKLTAEFGGVGYAAKEIVAFDAASKSFGTKTLLKNLDLKIFRNEHIALIGANGCGKTTLLKMITGGEQCDGGQVKVNVSVKPAYMPQIVTFENNDMTVLDTLRYHINSSEDKARSVLAGFHFMAADIMKKVGVLSGGEKSRLKLCLLMQDDVNLLLLDEPTNHLDIASREWIENALAGFEGTMLFVSHDRYFLNKFADKIWSMENGEITRYDCGFEEYLETTRPAAARTKNAARPETPTEKNEKRRPRPAKTPPGRPMKASPHLSKAVTDRPAKKVPVEKRISEAEAELRRIEAAVNSALSTSEYSKISELYKEKSALEKRIDALYDEWVG